MRKATSILVGVFISVLIGCVTVPNADESEPEAGHNPITDDLFSAIEQGRDPQLINTLLAGGAEADQVYDENGHTPLMRAAAVHPDPVVIETLVQSGADITATAGSDTVLSLAEQNPNEDVFYTVQGLLAIEER